jgi:AcrR family transcriptional regulator
MLHGVHAVGMQQIIDECGCGKNLLYREFENKDELVVAYLQGCRDDWQHIVDSIAGTYPVDPAFQLVSLVGAVAEQSVAEGFRGCPLRNVYSEFPDSDASVHRLVVAYYTERQAHLRKLACLTDAEDPDGLADRIALIIDGLNANGPVLGAVGAARSAVAFAADVVATATGHSRLTIPSR